MTTSQSGSEEKPNSSAEPAEVDQVLTSLDERLTWLVKANEMRCSPEEVVVLDERRFDQIEVGVEWSRRGQFLVFQPGNVYERWMTHGSIPLCFRHFICNPEYVGRAELALFLRFTLLMDPNGLYLETLDELREGLFSQAKQLYPVIERLKSKHLILEYENKVIVRWKNSQQRRIFQRPMAAYTIARLYYLGFEEEKKRGSKVVGTKQVYLDQSTFDRCVETLAKAYKSRKVKGVQRPEMTPELVRAWLFHAFLTETEQSSVTHLINDRFINTEAPAGAGKAKKRRPRARVRTKPSKSSAGKA